MEKIRYVDSQGTIRESERPLIKPLTINGEEGFGVYHSPITVTPTDVYRPQEIKPRFFSEEVADQRDAAEIRRKQADEKVKQMLSGKEYTKLGALTLAGASAVGLGAAAPLASGTVAGNFIGDAAGSMALGMGLEEGQRAAFGRSAGDIIYSQLKPYIGEFSANMARPEYILSPSMVLKNTYTQATNNLGRQFAISPQSQGVRKIRLKSMAERNPEIFGKEVTSVPYQKPLNFIPMYEGNVGEFSKRFKQEILDRLSNLGVDIDKPVTVTPNKVTGEITTTPRDFVNNSSDKVYYGIFGTRDDDLMSRQIGGVYAKDNGVVLADPTVEGTSAHHEVIGHRLFPIIRDLADKGTLEPYLNIYRSLKDRGNYVDITDIDELRATMLEVQHQIMKPIYEANPSNLSALRQQFQNAVDNLSDDELMSIVKNINGYGYDYAQSSKKETPHLIRQALKYAPITAGISIGLNNEVKKQRFNQ